MKLADQVRIKNREKHLAEVEEIRQQIHQAYELLQPDAVRQKVYDAMRYSTRLEYSEDYEENVEFWFERPAYGPWMIDFESTVSDSNFAKYGDVEGYNNLLGEAVRYAVDLLECEGFIGSFIGDRQVMFKLKETGENV